MKIVARFILVAGAVFVGIAAADPNGFETLYEEAKKRSNTPDRISTAKAGAIARFERYSDRDIRVSRVPIQTVMRLKRQPDGTTVYRCSVERVGSPDETRSENRVERDD